MIANETYSITFGPTADDMEQIKQWLIEEDKKAKSGFFCNWHLILPAFEENRICVIKLDGNSIGFLTWQTYKWKAFINIAEIKPDARKRGFCKLLVEAFLKYATTNGVLVVELQCSPASSERIWKKLGFMNFPENLAINGDTHLYKLTTNSIKPNQHNNKQEWLLELWDCETHIASNIDRKWWWNLNVSEVNQHVIFPAHYDWRMRLKKSGETIRDGKVKHLCNNDEMFYDKFFLFRNGKLAL